MMFAENIHTHQPSPAAARTMTEIKKELCLKILRPLFIQNTIFTLKRTAINALYGFYY